MKPTLRGGLPPEIALDGLRNVPDGKNGKYGAARVLSRARMALIPKG